MSLAKRIMREHLVEGELKPGRTIGLKIDQTLTQDATGTLAWLEFESLGLDRVRVGTAVSYVDHNLLQTDPKNADDHLFLRTAAGRFGAWFSEAGNGICHQVHLERFAAPGLTLLGSDSHTPMAGGLGELAIGAGGLDVAAAMAGQPFFLPCPRVVGVRLSGRLQPWVAGKDVILELLRRLTVKGGLGSILEYFGPGLAGLGLADRATICHMGAELGATSSLFPSDEVSRAWLVAQGRGRDFRELDSGPEDFDQVMDLDLSGLEPLIACPSSPDKVEPVSRVAGLEVAQVIVGSSGNSSFDSLSIAAEALKGRSVAPGVSLEINPGSRQVLANLAASGGLAALIQAGARLHQSGCLGCIGMGQAPASNTVSLRTFPRNFPGRSGTPGDRVYLCSPQTAVAAALAGKVSDPRDLGPAPKVVQPERFILNDSGLTPPPPPEEAGRVEIVLGPHASPFPRLEPLPEDLEAVVVIKLGDNVTTDDILPGGARVLPWRSNIDRLSRFAFEALDPDFADRCGRAAAAVVVGGENYGQGSSREHAALAPRRLGVRVKIARSFARIHRANLINFGVLPLTLADGADYERLQPGQSLVFPGLRRAVAEGRTSLEVRGPAGPIRLNLDLKDRERRMILAGGLLNLIKSQVQNRA